MGERADALGGPDHTTMNHELEQSLARADEATTEELRSEIEQTRAEMGETIDAIQEKLSPQHLTNQVKEAARDATIGKAEEMVQSARTTVQETARSIGDTAQETRSTLVETIKQNPVPAALVGLGLGWLWMNSRSTASHRYQGQVEYYRASGQSGYGRVPDWDQGRRSAVGGHGSSPGQMLHQGQQAVSQTVSQAGETAGQMVSQAQETAGQVASQAQQTAGQMASQAQQQARRLEDQFQQTLHEQPLAMGALALALGTAVGLLMPETRQERQYMGQASDRLMEQAQATAQETMHKVQRVAQEVQSTAQQEAKEQGLTQ